MSGAKFSNIFIVQSLPLGDELTGTKLQEDLETLNCFHEIGLNIKLIDINLKSQLIDELAKIEDQSRNKEIYPIIHLEIHGSDDAKGLALSSGEYVDWDELKEPLTRINIACKLNLVITLAVCFGGHLMQIIQPTDRAPCWGLIGPVDKIPSGSVLKTFYGFYRSLIETEDGEIALKELANNNKGNCPYAFTHAESLFKEIYSGYTQIYLSGHGLKERAKRMYRKAKNQGVERAKSVGYYKRLLKSTQKQYFYKYRDQFFMFDLYDENKARFKLEFSDIKK